MSEDTTDVAVAEPVTEVITSNSFDGKVEVSKSLSAGIKRMLSTEASDDRLTMLRAFDPEKDCKNLEDIYTLARDKNMTVEEFVISDPHFATVAVESNLAEWNNIIAQVAITGGVTRLDASGVEHVFSVSKNQIRALEYRVREAVRQVNLVHEYTLIAAREGELRKDQLERAMFRRALMGDDNLAKYLHDRVDGRPAETKQVEIDYDNTYNIYAVIKTLFDKQLNVLNSGSGVRLICCSRRAGKTHLLVAILFIECMRKPRTRVMYIGETMELAESLVDKAANDIIDACQLRDKRGRRFDWKHMDNGSTIMIRGLSNTKDPDQIRGQAAKVIVIDEFFHLKSELLEYMQREVLEPMQMDYADDYMFICAGTPPSVKGTYGEHVWNTWEVPHFSWTWRDNPHPVSVEAREKLVNDNLASKGLDWTSSFARREYNGEWAYEEDLLLYPDYHCYDPAEALPVIKPTRIVFGIDYGVGDNDTIWGAVWSDDDGKGYQFWETKFNRLDIMHLAVSQLEYLADQVRAAWYAALDYFPSLSLKEANKRILWDADDSDQHLTDYFNLNIRLTGKRQFDGDEEDYAELKLQIANAHKTDKTIMYDKIRDVLRRGDLLIIKGGKCARELDSTICKRGPNGEVYSEVDLKAYHPDLLPAMRYALWNVIGG